MKLRWISLLLPLFSSPLFGYQLPTEIIEQFDDSKIVAFINESQFANAKPWNPMSEAPPFTLQQAIQAMKQHYIDEKKDPAALSVSEIEVRKTLAHKELWHYIIKARVGHDTLYYLVLMNGSVIPAVVEPESYK